MTTVKKLKMLKKERMVLEPIMKERIMKRIKFRRNSN